jgi:hypothetical protein
MNSIRAIVVDPEVPGRLAIKEVEAPQAGPSEALVQVAVPTNRLADIPASVTFAQGQPYLLLDSLRYMRLRKEGFS